MLPYALTRMTLDETLSAPIYVVASLFLPRCIGDIAGVVKRSPMVWQATRVTVDDRKHRYARNALRRFENSARRYNYLDDTDRYCLSV